MRTRLLLLALAALGGAATATKLDLESGIKALAAWDQALEAAADNAPTIKGKVAEAVLKNGEGLEWVGTRPLGPLPLPSPVPVYTQRGPCSVAPTIKGLIKVPMVGPGAKNGTEDALIPELTLPVSCPNTTARASPWPVIVFYDGFSVPSIFYHSYAVHFASWGYAVVTYGHATMLDLIPDSVEVNYSPPVLDWAVATAIGAGSALGLAGGVGVTGHSMGGKLAALQWCSETAGMPAVRSAALISPVGHTLLTPTSTLTPSGPACVAAASPTKGPICLVDGAVRGNCNPPGVESSFRAWAGAMAPGSWSALVYHAGHADFVDVKPAAAAAAEAICFPGKGDADAAAVTAFAAGQATAWFDATMGCPDPAQPVLEAAFLAWAADQGAWMEWVVKS